jgi:hypothetical protein
MITRARRATGPGAKVAAVMLSESDRNSETMLPTKALAGTGRLRRGQADTHHGTASAYSRLCSVA